MTGDRALKSIQAEAVENRNAEINSPLSFSPHAVKRIWGGRTFAEQFGHQLPDDQAYGEIWDISALPHLVSRVADGPHFGKTLSDLWKSNRREFDSNVSADEDDFPLLVKWLDCRERLSVQVHPDDHLAREVLKQPRGKSEIWIVLEAEKTARIYAGFRAGISREQFMKHLEAGTPDECLHSFTPRAGDCVALPAGTVHAAGGGLLMAEIQQSSDTTFRLFDWKRISPSEEPRPLQIDLALRSIDWNQGPIFPLTPQPMQADRPGIRGELITPRSPFRVERYSLTQRWTVSYSAELAVWMVLDGAAILTHLQSGDQREVIRGRTILIPAAAGEISWCPRDRGVATVLLSVRFP